MCTTRRIAPCTLDARCTSANRQWLAERNQAMRRLLELELDPEAVDETGVTDEPIFVIEIDSDSDD